LGNVVSDPRSRKATSEWYPPSLANFRNAPKGRFAERGFTNSLQANAFEVSYRFPMERSEAPPPGNDTPNAVVPTAYDVW